jgi:hypothetical protein
VRVESLGDEPCRLVVPDWETAVVRGGTGPRPRVARGPSGDWVIELVRGASVVLAPDNVTPLADAVPVALPSSSHNPWPALKQDPGQNPGYGGP